MYSLTQRERERGWGGGSVLTQGRHLFGKVRPEATEETAIGHQVKGGVAPHRVEGEWVDGGREAGHVTTIGGHGDTTGRGSDWLAL